jgi:general secretion pathway protein H
MPPVAKVLTPISAPGTSITSSVISQPTPLGSRVLCEPVLLGPPISTRCAQGFTLIELIVVMLLLVVIAGMVALNLGDDDAGEVREEAQRLALLLNTAQEEAILQGQLFALAVEKRGYHFLQLTKNGTLEPLAKEDDVLRPRELPIGMNISEVEIDGTVKEQDEEIGIVLQPSGDVPDFVITFHKGTATWRVTGSMGDGIRSTQSLEGRATS